jgi:HKD family nuclease
MMADITLDLTDQPLEALVRVAHDYAGMNLEVAVAYISASGIFNLRPLMTAARRVRAVVGLAPLNRVNALRQLQDLGVDVSVYVPRPGTIFHPKIYYGTLKGAAWAMIGSSNLTASGLDLNIEVNLFIEGPRLREPFPELEATIEKFRRDARLLDDELIKELEIAEKRLGRQVNERAYSEYLISVGIRPSAPTRPVIPDEIQHLALSTFERYLKETRMVYAYQMLLCLVMLTRADEQGHFPQREAARCFLAFYQLRREAGLPLEKARGSRHAVIEVDSVDEAEVMRMVRIDPFPRFERQGLLEISDDGQEYVVNPALTEGLSSDARQRLRALAIRRLAEHFGEDEALIASLVNEAIG